MEMQKNSSTLVNKKTITSIAIGGFDGMHIAHQELFKNLDENGAIVSIESGFANLTPKRYRQEYSNYPIYYYVLDNIKHLEGDQFIKLLNEEFPNLKKIVVGYDFCFGKNRKYCTKDLKELFHGDVKIIDEIKLDDIAVHSRVIREYLKDGEIEVANKLLGKEYKIYGHQIKGQGLGSKSFVPTINLKVNEFLLPKEGVYITKTILEEKEYNSITFLGHRVSTDGSFAVETHILNEDIKNNNYTTQIKFIKKLRENLKFDSFEKLKNQILEDIETTKKYFINIY
ncbi:MAG: bifunctional riboflavin kinase/FAD synthetase [Arcobacter sp.]|jgi:riboflavin kinase/FMN adenylyltransferase|uniref:Riboflavin biosynthesis protein n=2 Tax=Arcobacteraceae TaxID=2808963 RepID=A0AAE7BID7_9BACT|nr:bifunctional riboflavin kinase/FAD synthetase [Arcobacter defluvii]QKF78437.1 bifunctional riboflavin kinase / FMN adenylyltransferase [Arcobacter defluvii]